MHTPSEAMDAEQSHNAGLRYLDEFTVCSKDVQNALSTAIGQAQAIFADPHTHFIIPDCIGLDSGFSPDKTMLVIGYPGRGHSPVREIVSIGSLSIQARKQVDVRVSFRIHPGLAKLFAKLDGERSQRRKIAEAKARKAYRRKRRNKR